VLKDDHKKAVKVVRRELKQKYRERFAEYESTLIADDVSEGKKSIEINLCSFKDRV
jgi:uncharacterized protein HemY